MDDFAEKLNDLLVDTFRSILKVEEQMVNRMGSLNLSISEVHLLESVEKCGDAGGTVSEIAKDLGITLSSVTVAVGKLVKKGYLSKSKTAADGRLVHVSLTPRGAKVAHVHGRFHEQLVREIAAGLSDQEKRVLISGVAKLNQFFDRSVL